MGRSTKLFVDTDASIKDGRRHLWPAARTVQLAPEVPFAAQFVFPLRHIGKIPQSGMRSHFANSDRKTLPPGGMVRAAQGARGLSGDV